MRREQEFRGVVRPRRLGVFGPYGLIGSTVNVVACALGGLFFIGAAVLENDLNFLIFVPLTVVLEIVFVRVLVRARRRQREDRLEELLRPSDNQSI